jgi:hypothetical protein
MAALRLAGAACLLHDLAHCSIASEATAHGIGQEYVRLKVRALPCKSYGR